MDDEQPRQADPTSVLLAEAGIPVPAADLGAVEKLRRNAGDAIATLRALRLMETEPMTTYATQSAEKEGNP